MQSSQLANKDFVVVQELFETETTKYADVVLPAASFAEMDGTYTNNTGFVQRVRQAIEPFNQAKSDWMITSLIAREMGADFGYNFSATMVFKAIADSISAYEGLRYPAFERRVTTRPSQTQNCGQKRFVERIMTRSKQMLKNWRTKPKKYGNAESRT